MTTTPDTIRVRFAPSPTGFLHVGSLRTALYPYLFARKTNGAFILRVEDTDQKRLVEGSVESLIDTLAVMGIAYDEGPFRAGAVPGVASDRYPGIVEKGEYGPYIQSERLALYRKFADELTAAGRAYPCFCTPERLEELRTEQTLLKRAPRYDKRCLALDPDEVRSRIGAGEPHVLRFNITTDRDEIVFDDAVRGRTSFRTKDIDDPVLLKSDGFPTYHLAVVVDDHLMAISHVIRGEEWIPSTPKHLLLYEAFGWTPPVFAHLPLLLNPDRSKLSKRQGDVAVEDYLAKGYLKEALLNFVALLGWNPGRGSTQEIFTLEELERVFDLAHVHKAGAVFDLKKLDWLNGAYIKQLSLDDLYERVCRGRFFDKPLVAEASEARRSEAALKRVLTVEQERLAKLSDVGEQNPFFFADPSPYAPTLLHWKENTADQTREALTRALDILNALPTGDWDDRKQLEAILMEAAGEKRGDFLWPLRVALSGAERSPSPFDVAWVLGRDESLERVRYAISRLE